jgi:hypothetical protein
MFAFWLTYAYKVRPHFLNDQSELVIIGVMIVCTTVGAMLFASALRPLNALAIGAIVLMIYCPLVFASLLPFGYVFACNLGGC